MSRRQPDRRAAPEIPDEVMDACPPCFVPIVWSDYLMQALARNTPGSTPARARVSAGLPPCPCGDCTKPFEARMRAAGKCTRETLESLIPVQSSTGES